jgi:hypothetical protein
VQRADSSSKGNLKNRYSTNDKAIAASGAKVYAGAGCEGCHGGTRGGGICPPLADGVWIYGGDGDALLRLIMDGSQTLQSKGYTRQAQENVVAPMAAARRWGPLMICGGSLAASVRSTTDRQNAGSAVRHRTTRDEGITQGDRHVTSG